MRVDLAFDPVRILNVCCDAVKADRTSIKPALTPDEVAVHIHRSSSIEGRLMPEGDIPTALESARSEYYKPSTVRSARRAQAERLVDEVGSLMRRLRAEIGNTYLQHFLGNLQKTLQKRNRAVLKDITSDRVELLHSLAGADMLPCTPPRVGGGTASASPEHEKSPTGVGLFPETP